MTWTRSLSLAVTLSLVIAALPGSAGGAINQWEEDLRMICSDSGRQSLPKKLTIRQVVDDSFFADATATNVVLFASYLFRWDVNKGKVIVEGLLLKSDGREEPLPRLAGKMKDGDAEKHKPAGTVFEPGDVIEWKVKLRGLAPLEDFDCWMLEVGIVGTDSEFGLANIISVSKLTRSRK